jgi:hypothetical protein
MLTAMLIAMLTAEAGGKNCLSSETGVTFGKTSQSGKKCSCVGRNVAVVLYDVTNFLVLVWAIH